jgi:hypothetical protein
MDKDGLGSAALYDFFNAFDIAVRVSVYELNARGFERDPKWSDVDETRASNATIYTVRRKGKPNMQVVIAAYKLMGDPVFPYYSIRPEYLDRRESNYAMADREFEEDVSELAKHIFTKLKDRYIDLPNPVDPEEEEMDVILKSLAQGRSDAVAIEKSIAGKGTPHDNI